MHSDLRKKKSQLVEELEGMKQKVSELEAYKASYLASEKELHENEEKLRLMFESVNDGITVTDLNGTITDVNKTVLKLGGFDSESDVVGMSAFESIAFRDRERALTDMLELRQQDTVGSGQYHLLRADGSEYPAEVSAGLLRDTAGKPAGFISVIRDITERKRAEEIFKTISLSSPMSIFIVQDGQFVFTNNRLRERMGFTEDELLCTNSLNLVHPEDREMVRRSAVEMLKGMRTTPYEYRIINEIEEIMWIAETVAPIQYMGKRAVLGSNVNITELKQTEERLRESRRRFRDLVNLLP
jgi:PAS domain S-box-containing protein